MYKMSNSNSNNSKGRSKEEQKLLDAARDRKVKAVRRLVGTEGVCIDVRNRDGNTPLLLACRGGHLEIMTILLEAGADKSVESKRGETLLHYAVHTSCEMVRLLLAAGCEADKADKPGYTPLHKACMSGSSVDIATLLERGADHNLANSNGDTPIHIACQFTKLQVFFSNQTWGRYTQEKQARNLRHRLVQYKYGYFSPLDSRPDSPR
jgi:ankyrin repeat protein